MPNRKQPGNAASAAPRKNSRRACVDPVAGLAASTVSAPADHDGPTVLGLSAVDHRRSLAIARALLPDVDLAHATLARGQFHDVVLVDGVAAVRIARRPEAGRLLERRTNLLRALTPLDLPFALPEPLGDVMQIDGQSAVATSWVPGTALPRGVGEPAQLGRLLDVLRDVPVDLVGQLLDEPHAYAGRANWYALMHEEVIPRLAPGVRHEAAMRIDAAHRLDAVPASLVHGDLGGDNLRWTAKGQLVGVLDWDLAQAFDPAVDAACLAWHGWDNVKAAVDASTYQRARVWQATFGIEQVGAAISNGEPPEVVDQYAVRASRWLASQCE